MERGDPRTRGIPRQRCRRCAVRFSWLTLWVNGALALLKSVIGLMAGSRALVASALYSVNDVLSSVVVMISVRVARRPADDAHAYGYGKAEFVAIGLVSTILAGAVIFILTYSVIDVLRGVEGPPHLIALPVAAVTMATNLLLARRGFCAAQRTESPILHTSAEHNHADAVSSLATMIGVTGAALGMHRLDPIVAIFETVHIVWLSGSLFGHAMRGLMDAALPESAVAAIEYACERVPGVEGVGRVRTRQSGAYVWIDVDVLVAPGTAVGRANQIRCAVEQAIVTAVPQSVRCQVQFRVGKRPAPAAGYAVAGGFRGQ